MILSACAAAPPAKKDQILVFPQPPEQPRYYFERTLYGSNDVIEETGTDRLRRFATGETERGRGFTKPFDVVAHEGRIFISDTVSRHIAVLDFPRKRYYRIGREGIGRLAKPLGIAVDNSGQFYVVDGTAKRVQIYDLEGNFRKTIGEKGQMERPSGLAVSPDGSRIYVVDNGGVRTKKHAVHIFDQSGTLIRTIGSRGSENAQFNLPLMAAVGPGGALHVVDTGNFRIQKFTRDGKFLKSFGKAGRFPGQFSHPKGIAVDGEGKIFVVDTGFANFQIFNADGRLLIFIGERSEQSGGPAKYLLPAGISVDVDGRIYVVDQFYRKIDVYRPATTPAVSPIGQAVIAPNS